MKKEHSNRKLHSGDGELGNGHACPIQQPVAKHDCDKQASDAYLEYLETIFAAAGQEPRLRSLPDLRLAYLFPVTSVLQVARR